MAVARPVGAVVQNQGLRSHSISMKKLIISATLAVLASSTRADLPLGRGEISATIDATATYDSNVFGTHDATADYSGTLTPRISYVRKAGQIEAEAHAQIAFLRFREQTQLNADNLDLGAALRIPKSDIRNYDGLLSAAYVESSEVNTDINARINTKTTTLVGQTNLTIGPRSNLALDGNYTDTLRSLGSDQQILTTTAVYNYSDFFYGNSLRVTGNYEDLQTSGDNSRGVELNQNSYMLSAGLVRSFSNNTVHAGLSYGYRILNRSAAETSTGTARQEGSVITATLDGPFLPEKYFPKITSQFALSYQDTATPGINDPGTKELTGSLLLGWQAREGTHVSFSVHRDQRLSVDDLSVVSTNVQLGIEQELRYNLTGTLRAGYDWSSYRTVDRQDKTASANAGLRYHFARAWDATLTYTLNSTTSNRRESTFDRNVFSAGVTYRF